MLGLQKIISGNKHLNTLHSTNGLARFYLYYGCYHEAMHLYIKTLKL